MLVQKGEGKENLHQQPLEAAGEKAELQKIKALDMEDIPAFKYYQVI